MQLFKYDKIWECHGILFFHLPVGVLGVFSAIKHDVKPTYLNDVLNCCFYNHVIRFSLIWNGFQWMWGSISNRWLKVLLGKLVTWRDVSGEMLDNSHIRATPSGVLRGRSPWTTKTSFIVRNCKCSLDSAILIIILNFEMLVLNLLLIKRIYSIPCSCDSLEGGTGWVKIKLNTNVVNGLVFSISQK